MPDSVSCVWKSHLALLALLVFSIALNIWLGELKICFLCSRNLASPGCPGCWGSSSDFQWTDFVICPPGLWAMCSRQRRPFNSQEFLFLLWGFYGICSMWWTYLWGARAAMWTNLPAQENEVCCLFRNAQQVWYSWVCFHLSCTSAIPRESKAWAFPSCSCLGSHTL